MKRHFRERDLLELSSRDLRSGEALGVVSVLVAVL